MSQSLKRASEHIPTFLHRLTLRQKLEIAVIRARRPGAVLAKDCANPPKLDR